MSAETASVAPWTSLGLRPTRRTGWCVCASTLTNSVPIAPPAPSIVCKVSLCPRETLSEREGLLNNVLLSMASQAECLLMAYSVEKLRFVPSRKIYSRFERRYARTGRGIRPHPGVGTSATLNGLRGRTASNCRALRYSTQNFRTRDREFFNRIGR
jgi:hypothetical protein